MLRILGFWEIFERQVSWLPASISASYHRDTWFFDAHIRYECLSTDLGIFPMVYASRRGKL